MISTVAIAKTLGILAAAGVITVTQANHAEAAFKHLAGFGHATNVMEETGNLGALLDSEGEISTSPCTPAPVATPSGFVGSISCDGYQTSGNVAFTFGTDPATGDQVLVGTDQYGKKATFDLSTGATSQADLAKLVTSTAAVTR